MVLQKLHEIMKKVGYVQKDMKVEMGAKGSYTVTSEKAVLQLIRPFLIEAKLIMIPEEVVSVEKTGSVTTLNMKYRMTDLEDNDSIIIAAIGQGTSSGDKGAGMAMTYAGKYALLKPLMMVTGDDPDKTGDVAHKEHFDELKVLASKLVEEINLLSRGGKIDGPTAQSMVQYIQKNAHDKIVLKGAENSINSLKAV